MFWVGCGLAGYFVGALGWWLITRLRKKRNPV